MVSHLWPNRDTGYGLVRLKRSDLSPNMSLCLYLKYIIRISSPSTMSVLRCPSSRVSTRREMGYDGLEKQRIHLLSNLGSHLRDPHRPTSTWGYLPMRCRRHSFKRPFALLYRKTCTHGQNRLIFIYGQKESLPIRILPYPRDIYLLNHITLLTCNPRVIAQPGIRSILVVDANIIVVVSFTVGSVHAPSVSRPLSSRFECRTLV